MGEKRRKSFDFPPYHHHHKYKFWTEIEEEEVKEKLGISRDRYSTSSPNWNSWFISRGSGDEWRRMIQEHNHNGYIIVEMSPYAAFNFLQVRIPHLSFLCCYPKCSFNQSLCNTLYIHPPPKINHRYIYTRVCVIWVRREREAYIMRITAHNIHSLFVA